MAESVGTRQSGSTFTPAPILGVGPIGAVAVEGELKHDGIVNLLIDAG